MILVAGGTGFIGAAVMSELRRRGEQVAVLGRAAERIRERFGDGVETRPADVGEPAYQRLLGKIEAIQKQQRIRSAARPD